MRDAQPTAIHLKDYQVPDFLIDKTKLTVDLNPGTTRVTSELIIRRNPESKHAAAPLVLNGQEIELQSVMLDGECLSDEQYQVAEESLTIERVPDEFVLAVVGLIHPEDNSSLEGLYRSSKMYCTQCEAEGFRKITYYLDRPDVLSEFETTVIGDKSQYPVLLSNGNPVDSGELEDGRHFVTWHDPHKKPAYLFALVAGDLSVIEDHFVTQSGRDVTIKIFVEPKDLDKCDHAMASLKHSMRWDEEVYGREYDLDIFMIVAVDDFNMGAMENKGLNIFNTSCVLANPKTTTDAGFQRVESVVAHEYFHNWSGNRVTCRDWFQLSLKEGFTVFRDSEFSADMGSRTIKRVEDVKVLRTMQFAEDAGPMAHPVQPPSFIEISNFYTLTIYEKGAEVVRMIHTLIGADAFRRGSDIYFERHDGCAVTINDFVQAMEEGSGRDLSQFKTWYHQAGTPIVSVTDRYNSADKSYTLEFTQRCPSTPEASEEAKKPYLIPVSVGLLDDKGPIALRSKDAFRVGDNDATDGVIELTEKKQKVTFTGVGSPPVPSLLRNFSAPVRLEFRYSRDQLVKLITKDTDGFNRWEASQQLAVSVIQEVQQGLAQGQQVSVDQRLVTAFGQLLADEHADPAMVAHMLSLPSEAYLAEIVDLAEVDLIHEARDYVRAIVAKELKREFANCFNRLPSYKEYRPIKEQFATRSLKNLCLDYLVTQGEEKWIKACFSQFNEANNMTDQAAALTLLVHSQAPLAQSLAEEALASFYQQWQHESLVVNLWFTIQATRPDKGILESIKKLMQHPAFTLGNPNKVRALIGAFANNNPVGFHRLDGQGYQLLSEVITQLNKDNPQIASRLLTPLTKWRKYDSSRQTLMHQQLEALSQLPNLSKDVFEVISKSLVS